MIDILFMLKFGFDSTVNSFYVDFQKQLKIHAALQVMFWKYCIQPREFFNFFKSYFGYSTDYTVLYKYCCNSTVAIVLLQQYYCNSTVATVLI